MEGEFLEDNNRELTNDNGNENYKKSNRFIFI